MKVAFWSNTHESTDASTMHAISFMRNILFGGTSVVLNTQTEEVTGNSIQERDQFTIEYLQTSTKILTDKILTGSYECKHFKHYWASIYSMGINILQSSNSKYKQKYERELQISIHNIITLAELCYENVYIDCGVGMNPLLERIFQAVDLVIINVKQNKLFKDDLFDYCNIWDNNLCFLLENYESESPLLMNNLFRMNTHLNSENIFYIPNNEEFNNAYSESLITKFFYRNIYCEPKDVNYSFIKEIRFITYRINELVNMNKSRKCGKIKKGGKIDAS